MFGYDLARTHHNPQETILSQSNVHELTLLPDWNAHANAEIISSPVIVRGILYIGSWDQQLYAFNATSGAKLWAQETGSSIGSSPAVAGNMAYIASQDKRVYAFILLRRIKKFTRLGYQTPGWMLTVLYLRSVPDSPEVDAMHLLRKMRNSTLTSLEAQRLLLSYLLLLLFVNGSLTGNVNMVEIAMVRGCII